MMAARKRKARKLSATNRRTHPSVSFCMTCLRTSQNVIVDCFLSLRTIQTSSTCESVKDAQVSESIQDHGESQGRKMGRVGYSGSHLSQKSSIHAARCFMTTYSFGTRRLCFANGAGIRRPTLSIKGDSSKSTDLPATFSGATLVRIHAKELHFSVRIKSSSLVVRASEANMPARKGPGRRIACSSILLLWYNTRLVSASRQNNSCGGSDGQRGDSFGGKKAFLFCEQHRCGISSRVYFWYSPSSTATGVTDPPNSPVVFGRDFPKRKSWFQKKRRFEGSYFFLLPHYVQEVVDLFVGHRPTLVLALFSNRHDAGFG